MRVAKLWPTFRDVVVLISGRQALKCSRQAFYKVMNKHASSETVTLSPNSVLVLFLIPFFPLLWDMQLCREQLCIYILLSQIYTMSRQKRVYRWCSAAWCLSLQIMNSHVFTSYHFSPLRWWESQTCSISGHTRSSNSDNAGGDMAHMSLFAVVWGSFDSRWWKPDRAHFLHYLFSAFAQWDFCMIG